MKNIKQIRYYADGSAENFPSSVNKNALQNGTAFRPYYPITQLGVQAIPGTKFYINGNKYPIIIGYTGIFELNSSLNYLVNSLTFSEESLNLINDNDNAYLLVDFVYEE